MIRKRKVNGLSQAAALLLVCLQQLVTAQIELAPANLGLKLNPPDAHVRAVPGRNPNLPPWFEDLGVDSFGEILGHTNIEDLKANSPVQSPLDNMGLTLGDEDPQSPHSGLSERVGSDGLVSVGEARSAVKVDGDENSSSDSSSSSSSSGIHVSLNGTDSWETIDLNSNSTDGTKNITNLAVTPVRLAGIPYPKEEPIEIHDIPLSNRNTLLSGAVNEKSLLPPPEKLEVEQYRPKPKNIPLWKPKSKAAEPPNLFILPADNPKRILSTNIDMMRPIVATSTFTTKISGSVMTSTTVSTIDQQALKFKSCIYGCPEMTSSDSLVGTTTIITVLPYQIPCSLVSCPPCPACFQSTISVSVCPVVGTVTAKARTSFVNGPTITVIRSTVTKTQCTATRTISAKPAPPETTTETVTVTVEGPSRSSSRHSSSNSKSEEQSPVSDETDRTPFVDPSLVLSGNSDHEEVVVPAKTAVTPSTITETILSTIYATPSRLLPSLTITKTVVSERVVVTVTTTAFPVTPVEETTRGVCSTFVICNPTQFTCPAQVTNLPQIKAVVEAIMDGQEKYGLGGAGTRRLTPNGAFIDDMGPPGLFGDGSEMAGGLNPVNRFGFGPGGMFEKVLGTDLIPPKETGTEILLPPGASSSASGSTQQTAATQAKMVMPEIPMSTTRILEAVVEPTAAVRRTKIKRARKQASSASEASGLSVQLAILAAIITFFLA